jgi:hypothetical protein
MRLCAFGADANLFKFYRNGLPVIHSEAQFDEFLAASGSFGCVYHNLDWSSAWEKALAAKLATMSDVREFANVRVFRSRPGSRDPITGQ